jgi:hypothetical protein
MSTASMTLEIACLLLYYCIHNAIDQAISKMMASAAAAAAAAAAYDSMS